MYSLLFFRNSYIYFIPFSGESWTVVRVLQGKDIQNKLCKGFEPSNFKKKKNHITFWTRYPLASQGCAPWLRIITTHASEQSFRAEIHQIACISANLGRGAHTPTDTHTPNRPHQKLLKAMWRGSHALGGGGRVPQPSPEPGGCLPGMHLLAS